MIKFSLLSKFSPLETIFLIKNPFSTLSGELHIRENSDCRTVCRPDTFQRTDLRLTLSRQTLSLSETSPTKHFPTRAFPLPEISPTKYFSTRTFPLLEISPTGYFPTKTFPKSEISQPDIFLARHFLTRIFPTPDISASIMRFYFFPWSYLSVKPRLIYRIHNNYICRVTYIYFYHFRGSFPTAIVLLIKSSKITN